MRKPKLTKELLADAAMGRILCTLNKEARDTLVDVSDEEWYKELDAIRRELKARDWKELTTIYFSSLVKDLKENDKPTSL